MTTQSIKAFAVLLAAMGLSFSLQTAAWAADRLPVAKGSSYLGIFPSILAEPEPYDYLDALEINILPFVFEYRPADQLGVQVRPLADLRLVSGKPVGISHVGGTIAAPYYWPSPWSLAHETFVTTGPFTTLSYNLLDDVTTVTVGAELGAAVYLDPGFSLNFSLQPGINWYPRPLQGAYSLLPHIGIIIHFGWVKPG